jgi:hypothetical protein
LSIAAKRSDPVLLVGFDVLDESRVVGVPRIEEVGARSLEQAARSYGFVRSLNLTGAPIHGLIDCVAANVFRWTTEERVNKKLNNRTI